MTKEYLQAGIEIAREAGAVLLEEVQRPPDIAYKGDYDLVTQADKRSEAVIVSRLQALFPQHKTKHTQHTGKECVGCVWWGGYPLDGTTNFAHGYPCFCVSMALAKGDELLLGVVYNPIFEEMFWAARGEGSYFNGKRIHCSKISELRRSLLCTGFPNHKRHSLPNIHYYWDFTLCSHGVRRDGSAALDLAYVAAGRFDGFWEFGLKPWDTAAGVVIVEEAGGKITDLGGKPYVLGGKSILATNGLIHAEMEKMAAEIERRGA